MGKFSSFLDSQKDNTIILCGKHFMGDLPTGPIVFMRYILVSNRSETYSEGADNIWIK